MDGRRGEVLSLLALGALLASTAARHLLLLNRVQAIEKSGDERFYLESAAVVSRSGANSLVPGRLHFEELRVGSWQRERLLDTLRHRAPLCLNAFAYLAPRAGATPIYQAIFFDRIRLFHLALLLVTLACLYLQGRLLDLGPGGSLVAPLLLAVSPWFGLYVHAAFAEPLRACLPNLAFVFLLAYMRSRRLALLVPAGLAAGYAVFARGALLPFMPVAAALVAASSWKAAPGLRRRLPRSLGAAALFAGSLALVVGPQLYVNWAAGIGPRLATNTWRNLDLGLRGPPPSDPSYDVWAADAKAAYFDSAPTYGGREEAAQTRVLRQGRWAGQTSRIAWAQTPSRAHAYAVLALAALGLVWFGWRSSGWLLVSAFALYHLAGLAITPMVPRFLVPVLPTLCLLAGGSLVSLAARGRRVVRPDARETRPP